MTKTVVNIIFINNNKQIYLNSTFRLQKHVNTFCTEILLKTFSLAQQTYRSQLKQ